MWSNGNGNSAVFDNTTSSTTITLGTAITAGTVTVGNNTNDANYTFTNGAGGSLNASTFVLQGNSNNNVTSSGYPTTTLNNATVALSGNLGVGRSQLVVEGSSSVTAATLGGGGIVSNPDWGYATIEGNANVTVNAVNGNTTAWGLNLLGGTLTTNSIQTSNFNVSNDGGAYLYFNGGTVVAARQQFIVCHHPVRPNRHRLHWQRRGDHQYQRLQYRHRGKPRQRIQCARRRARRTTTAA